MRSIVFRLLAAVSLSLAAFAVWSATRPRYGGTLRIEMRAEVASLDPADWPSDPARAAAKEKLGALVFDNLVRLDKDGQPQPALALSWQHDGESKQWQFRLRPNVKFHDGSPLTPAAVAAAIEQPATGWRVSAQGEAVVIESDRPMPGLLAELGRPRNRIFRRGPNEALVGTGPFRVVEWPSGGATTSPRGRVVLAINEDDWRGRPFLDTIEVEMGRPLRDQWIDFQLGKADIVEIEPDELRRGTQGGGKIWSSAPVELVALVFPPGRPAVEDARLREAIALSIDRAAMHTVLLQRQGEPARGLLPQWLSGYAFLFATPAELGRARRLRSQLPPGMPPLVLAYDPADSLGRAVAERIAVNAREAGIVLRVASEARGTQASRADARLVRVRIAGVEPREALAELAASLDLGEALRLPDPATPEETYAAERALLESFRVVPLFHLPETLGLGPRVKNWLASRWGGWRLDDVWLDGGKR